MTEIDPNDPSQLEVMLNIIRERFAEKNSVNPNPINALSRLQQHAQLPPPPPLPPPNQGQTIGRQPDPEQDPEMLPWERPSDLDAVMDNMSGWREMILRPGMAHAMLYVLMPVVQRADEYGDKESLVRDLQTWGSLTVAERVALTELFIWLENEMVNPDSSIPQVLRSNMERAQAGYEALAP